MFVRDSVECSALARSRCAVHAQRRALHVRTLDGTEEMPERGCRRFEVALILSRQGGDCSRGIILRVHGLVCCQISVVLVSRDVPFSFRRSLSREKERRSPGRFFLSN